MLQIVIGTVIAFLAIAGVAEIAHNIREFFFMPRENITMMIKSSGHDEKIEYLVRSLVLKAQGFQKASPVIIIVDEGMDEETRQICERLAGEYPFINICVPNEIASLVCSGNM